MADGVFAAMEMDERLLFRRRRRRRRRHMLIVLSSERGEARRGREREGIAGFVFRRNETNIQMVFVQKPRLGGKKRNDRRAREGSEAEYT